MTRRNAFMAFDALAGLALLAAMATALVVAFNLRGKNAQHLIEQRLANAAAQQALASLQAGAEAKAADEAGTITVQYTGKRVAGREWVEVTAVREGRRAQITGLAPTTQPGVTP